MKKQPSLLTLFPASQTDSGGRTLNDNPRINLECTKKAYVFTSGYGHKDQPSPLHCSLSDQFKPNRASSINFTCKKPDCSFNKRLLLSCLQCSTRWPVTNLDKYQNGQINSLGLCNIQNKWLTLAWTLTSTLARCLSTKEEHLLFFGL